MGKKEVETEHDIFKDLNKKLRSEISKLQKLGTNVDNWIKKCELLAEEQKTIKNYLEYTKVVKENKELKLSVENKEKEVKAFVTTFNNICVIYKQTSTIADPKERGLTFFTEVKNLLRLDALDKQGESQGDTSQGNQRGQSPVEPVEGKAAENKEGS